MKSLNPLRIAVQSHGRLSEPSLSYLRSLGLDFKSNGRVLITSCENFDLQILHLRDDDIPEYVSREVADFGIVGENVLYEKKAKVKILKKLGFGRCSLVIAVPENSSLKTLSDLEGERVATTYPRILSSFLKEKGVNAAIIPIEGSVEIAPSLNLADAICDLTQTGKTLKENRLVPILKILESEAVLIESTSPKKEKSELMLRINR